MNLLVARREPVRVRKTTMGASSTKVDIANRVKKQPSENHRDSIDVGTKSIYSAGNIAATHPRKIYLFKKQNNKTHNIDTTKIVCIT